MSECQFCEHAMTDECADCFSLNGRMRSSKTTISQLRAKLAAAEAENERLKCCGNCSEIKDNQTYHSCKNPYGCTRSPTFDIARAELMFEDVMDHWQPRKRATNE